MTPAAVKAYNDRRRAAGLCRIGGCIEDTQGKSICETHRVTENLRSAKRHQERRMRCFEAYGGPICVGCGETELCCLSFDHIKGGGGKHRQEVGFGWQFYGWLIRNNFPPGFRVLCMNCQFRTKFGYPLPSNKR